MNKNLVSDLRAVGFDVRTDDDLFCGCESSLCDHTDEERTAEYGFTFTKSCERPASGKVRMQFIGYCCDTCADNMVKTGCAHYIFDLKEGEWVRRGEWVAKG